jgi:hypothetical protein
MANNGFLGQIVSDELAEHFREGFINTQRVKSIQLHGNFDPLVVADLEGIFCPLKFSLDPNLDVYAIRSHPVAAAGRQIATALASRHEYPGSLRIGHDFSQIDEDHHHCFLIDGRDEIRATKAAHKSRNVDTRVSSGLILRGLSNRTACTRGAADCRYRSNVGVMVDVYDLDYKDMYKVFLNHSLTTVHAYLMLPEEITYDYYAEKNIRYRYTITTDRKTITQYFNCGSLGYTHDYKTWQQWCCESYYQGERFGLVFERQFSFGPYWYVKVSKVSKPLTISTYIPSRFLEYVEIFDFPSNIGLLNTLVSKKVTDSQLLTELKKFRRILVPREIIEKLMQHCLVREDDNFRRQIVSTMLKTLTSRISVNNYEIQTGYDPGCNNFMPICVAIYIAAAVQRQLETKTIGWFINALKSELPSQAPLFGYEAKTIDFITRIEKIRPLCESKPQVYVPDKGMDVDERVIFYHGDCEMKTLSRLKYGTEEFANDYMGVNPKSIRAEVEELFRDKIRATESHVGPIVRKDEECYHERPVVASEPGCFDNQDRYCIDESYIIKKYNFDSELDRQEVTKRIAFKRFSEPFILKPFRMIQNCFRLVVRGSLRSAILDHNLKNYKRPLSSYCDECNIYRNMTRWTNHNFVQPSGVEGEVIKQLSTAFKNADKFDLTFINDYSDIINAHPFILGYLADRDNITVKRIPDSDVLYLAPNQFNYEFRNSNLTRSLETAAYASLAAIVSAKVKPLYEFQPLKLFGPTLIKFLSSREFLKNNLLNIGKSVINIKFTTPKFLNVSKTLSVATIAFAFYRILRGAMSGKQSEHDLEFYSSEEYYNKIAEDLEEDNDDREDSEGEDVTGRRQEDMEPDAPSESDWDSDHTDESTTTEFEINENMAAKIVDRELLLRTHGGPNEHGFLINYNSAAELKEILNDAQVLLDSRKCHVIQAYEGLGFQTPLGASITRRVVESANIDIEFISSNRCVECEKMSASIYKDERYSIVDGKLELHGPTPEIKNDISFQATELTYTNKNMIELLEKELTSIAREGFNDSKFGSINKKARDAIMETIKDLKSLPPESSMTKTVFGIVGKAGTGKSYTAKKLLRGRKSTIQVITPYKRLCEEYRQDGFNSRSFRVAMEMKDNEDILLDEVYVLSPGMFIFYFLKVGEAELYMVGDPLQMAYYDKFKIYDPQEIRDFYKFSDVFPVLDVSFSVPIDICYYLNKHFNYGIKTASKVYSSVKMHYNMMPDSTKDVWCFTTRRKEQAAGLGGNWNCCSSIQGLRVKTGYLVIETNSKMLIKNVLCCCSALSGAKSLGYARTTQANSLLGHPSG